MATTKKKFTAKQAAALAKKNAQPEVQTERRVNDLLEVIKVTAENGFNQTVLYVPNNVVDAVEDRLIELGYGVSMVTGELEFAPLKPHVPWYKRIFSVRESRDDYDWLTEPSFINSSTKIKVTW